MSENVVSTPTQIRCITSYAARTQYKPGAVHPPDITVKDAIDIHVHAHEGQQDPYALVRRASKAQMKGMLFKSIAGKDQAESTRLLQEDLNRWADQEGVEPITCYAGYICGRQREPISAENVRKAIDSGVTAVWLPVFTHANTLNKVGTYRFMLDAKTDDRSWTGPLSWETALEHGRYTLQENGSLKAEVEEILQMIADAGICLFFGHATKKEIFKLAEAVQRLEIRCAVVDHPFSPFIDLTVDEMKQLSDLPIFFIFTFDELSPLLGVDPQIMYDSIKEVGVAHCTLSSDAGEPLFPDSVEAMRLVRGYMEAFGMTEDELYTLCTTNPGQVVGIS